MWIPTPTEFLVCVEVVVVVVAVPKTADLPREGEHQEFFGKERNRKEKKNLFVGGQQTFLETDSPYFTSDFHLFEGLLNLPFTRQRGKLHVSWPLRSSHWLAHPWRLTNMKPVLKNEKNKHLRCFCEELSCRT